MAGTLLVIFACLLWGVDTLIRYPLVESGISPVTIVFYEHLLLTLIFTSWLIPAFRRLGELNVADIFSFLVIGGLVPLLARLPSRNPFIISIPPW
jgi:hypothetical protein